MKKVFVIPYFGIFPNYIQLWLNSCERNIEFSWLMLTNCSIESLSIPNNVIVKNTNLKEIRGIFSRELGEGICLNQNYKLCDFRPVYWMLLDYYQINYDYWGYCDVDLIFGNLSHFITDDLLKKYDRIYSFGHLSLMSNSPISKYAFLYEGSEVMWQQVFFDERNFGFDEHHGINKIWNKPGFLFYKGEREILDIAPEFNDFRLTYIPLNKRSQFFFSEEGRIFQGHLKKSGRIIKKEYAYIHFQKRNMPLNDSINMLKGNFMISGKGFFSYDGAFSFKLGKNYTLRTSEKESLLTQIKKVRSFMRFYKQKIYKSRLFNDI